jgi:predicted phage terminase large subunit-like protein
MAMKTFIHNEMAKRGIFFSLTTVSRTTQKLSVLKGFQPVVELGRFWLPEDRMEKFTEELLNEMAMVTNDGIKARHDDLIDSISMLTLIEVISTTPITEDSYLDDQEISNPYIF